MAWHQDRDRDRIKSAIGVAAFHALLGYALIVGFGYHATGEVAEDLKLFDIAPEPPPPPEVEPAKPEALKEKPRTKNSEGAASPKNLKDTPSPVVAPPPVIPLPLPSPVVAAPVAGMGDRDSAGASDVPGPGTGSGGQGTGTGSGDAGDGNGGGGGGGAARRARWIDGRIKNSDYPPAAAKIDAGGTVFMRFIVSAKGRVGGCTVTRSSGRADLDETTCRLITKRFRYKPARNGEGKAVPQVVEGKHKWFMVKRDDPPIEEEEEFGDSHGEDSDSSH